MPSEFGKNSNAEGLRVGAVDLLVDILTCPVTPKAPSELGVGWESDGFCDVLGPSIDKRASESSEYFLSRVSRLFKTHAIRCDI